MTRKRLAKLRRKISELRARPRGIRHRDLKGIAEALGRTRFATGKEPTFICDWGFPLTIPAHPGTLPIGTALNILNQLANDIDLLAAQLPDDENVQ